MSSESSVLCATKQNSIIWHRAHRYFKHWSAWKESLWPMMMIPTHLEKLSWGTRGDLFSCSMASWGEGAGKGSTRLGGLPGLGWGLIMIKHIIRDRYSGILMIKVCSLWPKRSQRGQLKLKTSTEAVKAKSMLCLFFYWRLSLNNSNPAVYVWTAVFLWFTKFLWYSF